VRQYAKNPDGSFDPELARRIDLEVHRRGTLGRQLDIYEPLVWTGKSFLLTVAAGIASAVLWKKDGKSFTLGALVGLTAATGISSVIQLVRLIPRYHRGLRGGMETAVALRQREYDIAVPSIMEPEKSGKETFSTATGWVDAAKRASESMSQRTK
jgi:hypothetical protein